MYGWVGKIIRVNLSSGRIEKVPLSDYLAHNYIGGRGINVRILYDEIKPGIDGFDPENRLIFGTGPLGGTPVGAGRFNVTFKSPLTNILGDSNSGGHFAPELKYAGHDHIIISGKANGPIYLWIDDDKIELRNAEHLWGKTTDETTRMIREELGDPRIEIACIGPSGEKLVRFACIITDLDRAAGKMGAGAVMGSKNLKAVAVRGTGSIKLAEPEAFRILAKNLMRRTTENVKWATFKLYGTAEITDAMDKMGMLAIRNNQLTGLPWEKIDGVRAKTFKKYSTKMRGCSGCVNACHMWLEFKEGPFSGERGVAIEYSGIAGFGPLCDNDYAPSIFKACKLCNEYGIDHLECAHMIATAMDWYDQGLITSIDTEGIKLEWGNYSAIIEMIHKIAKREGFGYVLAEGPLRAAEKIGGRAVDCVTHAKGSQFANDDSYKFNRAALLGEATSTRGGDHLRGTLNYFGERMPDKSKYKGPKIGNLGSYEDMAGPVYYIQTLNTLADALEVCKFVTARSMQEMGVKDMADLFSAATGVRADEAEMKKIADRIWSVEKAFSVREGITRKDDAVFGRVITDPVSSGPYKGLAHDQRQYDKMLDEYYDLVGWDKKTGVPTREKLESLGLEDVADDLAAMGK